MKLDCVCVHACELIDIKTRIYILRAVGSKFINWNDNENEHMIIVMIS